MNKITKISLKTISIKQNRINPWMLSGAFISLLIKTCINIMDKERKTTTFLDFIDAIAIASIIFNNNIVKESLKHE